MSAEKDIEVKNIINWIVSKFLNVINFTGFRNKIDKLVEDQYVDGMEKLEIEFNMNFVPNDKDLDFLKDYVDGNVGNVAEEINQNLRGELSRGILNKEKISQLKTRIRNVFKDKKYANRLKMVLRTEALRANNTGKLEGMKQSNLKLKKWISIIRDNRTSDICIQEDSKYGSPDKAIDLDKEFIVKVNNKTVRAQAPPFHVNCRSLVRYERQED